MPLPKKLPLSSNVLKSDAPAKPKERLANRYCVEQTLGKGNCGTALLVLDLKAKDEREKKKVAKKVFVGNLLADETVGAAAEAHLLKSLDHLNIVKFYDSFVEGEFFCIVTEYCNGGDLDTRITKFKKEKQIFTEDRVFEWIIELLLALQYMHSRKILHRDLKTRNIFLHNDLAKIGDFGISRILKGSADMASTFVGTPYYMSPEVLKHEGYNSKSDIWSLGCILYDLVALEHPFQGKTLMGVMYKITEEDPPPWPDMYSSDLKELFHKMLEKNPEKRLSASEALKLPFVIKHAEHLRNTIVVKHQSKEENDVVNHDTEEIASALSNRAKLSDLKRESEQKKFKNLPPRERFRIERQKRADEELQRMKALTLQQAKETKANYEAVRQAQNPYRSTIPLGEQRNREFSATANITDTRPYTIPGIPESKEDAERYYGQFLDDFEDEDEQSDDDRRAMVNLVNNLQFVLDDNDQTLTDHTLVSDDREAGPYGPGAKEWKIKNLRTEATKILGEDKFKKVYDCIRRMLFTDKQGKKASEHELGVELRKITDRLEGCFIVEQLVFLQCST